MAWDWVLFVALAAAPAQGGGAGAGADLPARPGRADSQEVQEVIIGRYRLKPKASGGYRAETDTFIAWIAADGAVSFESRPRLPGPAVLPAIIVGQLMETKSSNLARGVTGELQRQATNPALILADDDLRNDPHHGPKMAFLEETAAFREDMQRRNDTTALGGFRKQVEAAATDRALSPRQRRLNLFELWVECDETARGTPARAVVERAIRRHFPAGGPDAYAPHELAAFNRRAGKFLRFDPYAAAPAAAPAVPAATAK